MWRELVRPAILQARFANIPESSGFSRGEYVNIRQLTEPVTSVVGYQGEIHWDTSKPNATPRKLLDVSKAKDLGWIYRTELEEGLKLAYKDFLENPMRAER